MHVDTTAYTGDGEKFVKLTGTSVFTLVLGKFANFV